jgi:hypothetical protein
MKRYVNGLAGMLLVIVIALALSGWSGVPVEGKAAAPSGDVKALAQLADGIIGKEDRLWVVTVRGEDHHVYRWSGNSGSEALRWMNETAASWPAASGSPSWNINVQGILADDKTVSAVWEQAERDADAAVVEAYEDQRTYSKTYLSPAFHTVLRSGDAEFNLQAAAHKDTESGKWRITLGTPAVLIEY